MYLYIAYRNLKDHYEPNSVCGGQAYNNDYRFTAIFDGVYYLLTKDNMNYAVPFRLFRRGILNCARSITAFTLSLITLRLPLSGHSIRIRR